MNPTQRYQHLLKTNKLRPDPNQAQVVSQLQRLYDDLLSKPPRGWRQRLRAPAPIQGIYLWGGVGIGKTFLMDMLFHCLPPERKLRLHFHRFMRQIHQQLRTLQGKKNPLRVIAKQLAQRVDILCFDEFFVADIVDAMVLSNLLGALFEQGLVLFTTSNVAPDDLYRHGIQRERFLPAIDRLKTHTQVVHVQSQQDYRLQTHQQAGTYYPNFEPESCTQFKHHFVQLAGEGVAWDQQLPLGSHRLSVVGVGADVIWFKFNALVNIPNCQRDYLEIAQSYHTVFLSDVPVMGVSDTDLICNFISLVDIFYDAQIKLIIQAVGPIDELYPRGKMAFAYQRTQSRLTEMQSSEYLAKPHMALSKLNEEHATADSYAWDDELNK